MKKKIVIICIISVVAILLIFLFRVSIYNSISKNKIKKVTNTFNVQQFLTGSDYIISYGDSKDETIPWSGDNYNIYEDKNKIIYYTTKKPVFPHLGFDDTYITIKIDDFTSSDIAVMKKYLNKKVNKAERESIYIYSYTKKDVGYISNKSQAQDLYDILERVKNR